MKMRLRYFLIWYLITSSVSFYIGYYVKPSELVYWGIVMLICLVSTIAYICGACVGAKFGHEGDK